MGADARLNLLLTPQAQHAGKSQPWHQTLSQLLTPLGVRTFEASDGPHAMELIERHPIHLAVVDARLPTISGINVLQLVQRLREQHERAQKAEASKPPQPGSPGLTATHGFDFQFQMHVEETTTEGQTQRRIEVRFDARPAKPVGGPVVILIAPPPPQQDPQFLQEALKFNAFSVLSEPVDVNLALDTMARALKRFHQNQWPA